MMNSLLRSGRWIFAFAIAALGAENIFCAHGLYASLGPNTHSMPVLPFLPAIPWLVVLFGILWIACAIGLLTARWLRASAYALGATYIFWTLVHVLPYYIASPGDMGLRTVVFEPLSLACIALLLPGPAATPKWLAVALPRRHCHRHDRLRRRSLYWYRLYWLVASRLDPIARALGCVLRSSVHCRRHRNRHRVFSSAGAGSRSGRCSPSG